MPRCEIYTVTGDAIQKTTSTSHQGAAARREEPTVSHNNRFPMASISSRGEHIREMGEPASHPTDVLLSPGPHGGPGALLLHPVPAVLCPGPVGCGLGDFWRTATYSHGFPGGLVFCDFASFYLLRLVGHFTGAKTGPSL